MKYLLIITCVGATLTIGNACAMDEGKIAWAVKRVETDKLKFINVPAHHAHLTKEELRNLITQPLVATTVEGDENNPTSVTVDFLKIPSLANEPQETPSRARRLLTHGATLTLGVGIGFLVAQKLKSSE